MVVYRCFLVMQAIGKFPSRKVLYPGTDRWWSNRMTLEVVFINRTLVGNFISVCWFALVTPSTASFRRPLQMASMLDCSNAIGEGGLVTWSRGARRRAWWAQTWWALGELPAPAALSAFAAWLQHTLLYYPTDPW